MKNEQCVFCRIIKGTEPAQLLYQDEWITAFHDHLPIAPVHILLVPNKHIASLNQLSNSEHQVIGHLVHKASELAAEMNLTSDGYRLTVNTGADAGQTVFHVHFHLLGGRQLGRMG